MKCGILTACNDNPMFQRTVRALAESCQELGAPLTVVNHGLRHETETILRFFGADIVEDTVDDFLDYSLLDDGFQRKVKAPQKAWKKPLLCKNSPYDYTVWIDADAVLLRGWDKIANMTIDRDWVTRDWWTEEARSERLYKEVIESISGHYEPSFMNERTHINTGVFGFRKDAPWIDRWIETCALLLSTPEHLAACKCRDQSAMAVHMALGSGEKPKFIEDPAFNYPANGLTPNKCRRRKCYKSNEHDFLDAIRGDHPNTYVVHWLGRPKPVFREN